MSPLASPLFKIGRSLQCLKVEFCSRPWASCQEQAKCNNLEKANNCEMLLHYLDIARRETNSGNIMCELLGLEVTELSVSSSTTPQGSSAPSVALCINLITISRLLMPPTCHILLQLTASLTELLVLFVLKRVETDGTDPSKCLEGKRKGVGAYRRKQRQR